MLPLTSSSLTAPYPSVEPAPELTRRIINLLNKNKRKEALNELSAQLNVKPLGEEERVAKVWRAYILFTNFNRIDAPKAVEELHSVVTSYPHSPFSADSLQEFQETRGASGSWLPRLNFILDHEPKLFPALLLRAEMHLRRVEREPIALDRANENLEAALALHSNSKDLWITLALAHKKQNQPGEAIKDLTQALEIDPQNDKLLAFRGDLYLRKKDSQSAAVDFIEALRINPKNTMAKKKLESSLQSV